MKEHLCLEITKTEVQFAILRRGRGQEIEVVDEGEHPLPQQSGVTTPFDHPALLQTIRDLFRLSDSRASNSQERKILLSVTGDGVLFKRIRIPTFSDASSSQQTAAIETDLENQISLPLDEAAYDWAKTGEFDDQMHLLIAWMRKKPLESLCSKLKSIGFQPIYAMPTPLVLANQLRFTENGSDRICGIHVDGTAIDMTVIENREVMGGRRFERAGLTDTTAFWRTLRQSLASVANPNGTALQRVVLFQAGVGAEYALNPDDVSIQLEAPTDDISGASYPWATSLLRSYTQEDGISLNLLHPILRQNALERKLRQRRQVKRFIPLAATVVLAFANVGLRQVTESERIGVETMQHTQSTATNQQRAMKSLEEKRLTLEKQNAEIAWSERGFPPLATRFESISAAIPDTVRLTEIWTPEPPRTQDAHAAFDARETLLLRGVAQSQEEIDAFRAALSTHEAFRLVRQIQSEQMTRQGMKWLEFTLSLQSRHNISQVNGGG